MRAVRGREGIRSYILIHIDITYELFPNEPAVRVWTDRDCPSSVGATCGATLEPSERTYIRVYQ